ncbi:MAG: signal peptidase I [Candidatus Omnitrophica bacterium]|nr:signal peptidase I [Candidatus Omnitrophota bacterium]
MELRPEGAKLERWETQGDYFALVLTGTQASGVAGVEISGFSNLAGGQTLTVDVAVDGYVPLEQARPELKIIVLSNNRDHKETDALIARRYLDELPVDRTTGLRLAIPAGIKPLSVQLVVEGAAAARLRVHRALANHARRILAFKSALQENIESLVWAVAIALFIRTFIVAPFKIPSGSMRPTLMEGDRILVSKFSYRFHEPHRADIVVFRYPEDPKRPFIKRLAGIGNDQVEIRDGHVLVNGQPSDSPVMQHIRYINQGPYGQEARPIHVPGGMFFVLGDNSPSSHDSRFWGFVPRKLMIGRALCIFWPPQRIRLLH